jgi:hypothetical protein
MKNPFLLIVAICLISLGLFGSNSISNISIVPSNQITDNYVIDAPKDPILLEKSNIVVEILQKSSANNKTNDCLRLSSLYADLATLISLSDNDQIVKDTVTIREANILAGKMLKLNISDKYPNLAEATNNLVVSSIGDEDVGLDSKLREKAINSFKALSWAFYKGSK